MSDITRQPPPWPEPPRAASAEPIARRVALSSCRPSAYAKRSTSTRAFARTTTSGITVAVKDLDACLGVVRLHEPTGGASLTKTLTREATRAATDSLKW